RPAGEAEPRPYKYRCNLPALLHPSLERAERLRDDAEGVAQLLAGDGEGRRDDDDAVFAADPDAGFEKGAVELAHDAVPGALPGDHRLLGLAVAHELDAEEGAEAAIVADDLVTLVERLQLLIQPFLDLVGALE